MPAHSAPGRLVRLLSAVTGLLSTHLRLFGMEVQEEMDRIVVVSLLTTALTVFFSMFLMVVTLLLLLAWDQYRVMIASLLTVVYGGLALVCLLLIRRNLRSGHLPFSGTADEIEKDRQLLPGATVEEEGA